MNLKRLLYLSVFLILTASCKKDKEKQNPFNGLLKKIAYNQDTFTFNYNNDRSLKTIELAFSDLVIARSEYKHENGKPMEWTDYDANGYLSPIRKAGNGTYEYNGKLITKATRIIYPNSIDINIMVDEFSYDNRNFLKGYTIKSGIGLNPSNMQPFKNTSCTTDQNGNITKTLTNSYFDGQLNEVIESVYEYDDKINVRKGLIAPVEVLDFFNKNNWIKRTTSINGLLVTVETRQYTYNSIGKPTQFISKYNGENPSIFSFEYY